jgi:DNA-directed RNA polymerase specialized sigma24 family protein
MEVSKFEQAALAYSPKIATFSKKTFRYIPGFEQQDLEAEMLEVLWKCVNAYDPNQGAGFNTLFWRSAHRRLISIRRYYAAKKRAAEWVLLDEEEFVAVCDSVIHDYSAEEWVMAFEEVRTFRA